MFGNRFGWNPLGDLEKVVPHEGVRVQPLIKFYVNGIDCVPWIVCKGSLMGVKNLSCNLQDSPNGVNCLCQAPPK